MSFLKDNCGSESLPPATAGIMLRKIIDLRINCGPQRIGISIPLIDRAACQALASCPNWALIAAGIAGLYSYLTQSSRPIVARPDLLGQTKKLRPSSAMEMKHPNTDGEGGRRDTIWRQWACRLLGAHDLCPSQFLEILASPPSRTGGMPKRWLS